MNLGPPIDWSATGTMLTGVATLTAAFAVIWAAKLGNDTFASWKRQRVAGRKIEFAEEFLVAFYRFERSLTFVRGPMQFAGDIARAEETLRETFTNFDNLSDDLKSRRVVGQIAFHRIEHEKEVFQRATELLPTAKALFPELGKHQETLLRELNRVRISAQSYAREGYISDGYRQKLEDDLWLGGEECDRIALAISEAKEAMEGQLLSIISDSIND